MDFKDLLGKTLTECSEGTGGVSEVLFRTTEGKTYRLSHIQDCCEEVELQDLCGDLSDLVGSPITQAEENSSGEHTPVRCEDGGDQFGMWTFYRIATAKGQVVMRWYGESNGYYSESVDFEEVSSC